MRTNTLIVSHPGYTITLSKGIPVDDASEFKVRILLRKLREVRKNTFRTVWEHELIVAEGEFGETDFSPHFVSLLGDWGVDGSDQALIAWKVEQKLIAFKAIRHKAEVWVDRDSKPEVKPKSIAKAFEGDGEREDAENVGKQEGNGDGPDLRSQKNEMVEETS